LAWSYEDIGQKINIKVVDIIDMQSVTLKQYRSALETYVREILGNLEQNRGKMFLINSPMGSGKTYTMGKILSEVSHSVLWLGLYHDTLTVTSHIEIAFFLTVFGVDCGAPKGAVLTLIGALENLSRNSVARVV
jgi:superfamily II DNA or RNA helicase